MTKGLKSKAMYVSDIHIPFNDIQATEQFFVALKREKPDMLVLGGDLVDFFNISTHVKGRYPMPSIDEEIDAAKKFLARLRKTAKHAKIYWLEGNHENRLERYICSNALELGVLSSLTIPEMFDLQKFDIEYVPDTKLLVWNNILFRHGHEMMGQSGVPGNNARKALGIYGMNYIQGHVHKANVIRDSTFKSTLVGIENPCLCTITPEFMKGAAKWQQGWTVIHIDERERIQVRQTVV